MARRRRQVEPDFAEAVTRSIAMRVFTGEHCYVFRTRIASGGFTRWQVGVYPDATTAEGHGTSAVIDALRERRDA